MNITDFLLARIAEDEAAYRAESAGIEWLTVNGRGLWDRLLAECEAQRRIVEHAARAHEMAKVGPSAGDGAWFLACRYLAVPYADHPDYRPEWRP